MSEVTTLSQNSRLPASAQGAVRHASPDSTRQAVQGQAPNEGGSVLPPSSSSQPNSSAAVNAAQGSDSRAEQVDAAVSRMNEYIQSTQRDLRFSIDEESGETVVKVLDRQTEEVIRQIPDEVFLKLARSLNDNEPVHFFSEQA